MKRRHVGGLLLAGILSTSITAQMQDGYLDVFIAKVKMGKRMEFDAINKRMAEINHKNKGDSWLAYEVVYGEPNTIYFVSTRNNYTAAEAGTKAFEGSLTESLGKAGMKKISDAFDATVDSERAEFRRRRWDLSANAPADATAYARLVGEARYIRVVKVRLRPGRIPDYEAQLKLNKEAQEQGNPGVPSFVSQSVAGEPLGVFYISNLVKSLGDLDKIKTLQEVLGNKYSDYQRAVSESVASSEIMIGRMLPELSNPPEEIASVDPKFWRPAPPPAPPAPAKAAETKK